MGDRRKKPKDLDKKKSLRLLERQLNIKNSFEKKTVLGL